MIPAGTLASAKRESVQKNYRKLLQQKIHFHDKKTEKVWRKVKTTKITKQTLEFVIIFSKKGTSVFETKFMSQKR